MHWCFHLALYENTILFSLISTGYALVIGLTMYQYLLRILLSLHQIFIQGSYGQGKPGKVREFQNFSKVREKSGNFTITQRLEKTFKNQNFGKYSEVWKFSKLFKKIGKLYMNWESYQHCLIFYLSNPPLFFLWNNF